MKTVKEKIAHLHECYQKLDALKNLEYIEELTSNKDLDENDNSVSGEFEFSQAYTNPEEAIKLLVEISLSLEEINGGRRPKLVSKEKRDKIMTARHGREILASSLYTIKNQIIIPKSV